MKLQDGPMAGVEVEERSGVSSVLYPTLESDGVHFATHHYTTDGRWLRSETYVGYESDESIARREAFWDQWYWERLEADSDRSFV